MRRALYIIGVFLVSLLLVMIMFTAVLMSDRVQTAAVQWATEEFAEALGTNAHVGEVNYHFPARISIHDIYLEDLNHDTLCYIDELYVHFKPLSLLHNEVRFSHANVNKAVIKLYEQNGEWNYQFFVDGLGLNKPSASSEEPSDQLLAVQDITFDSVHVTYGEYNMLLSHASMDLNELKANSLDAQIRQLALQIDKPTDPTVKPFVVQDLSARLIQNDSVLSLPTLKAQLAQSHLDMSGIEVRIPSDSTMTEEQRVQETTYAVNFRKAEIIPADIALFVPKVKGMRSPFVLDGTIRGTRDSLCCENIELHYNNHPVLAGHVCITGMPDLENTYLEANLTDLQTNAARLQDFLSQLNNRPTLLPPTVHRLGDIHYRGTLEGRLHDLTLHGGFRTALGAISTNGTLVSDSDFTHTQYDLKLVSRNFRLGKLLNNPKITTMTVDFDSKGEIVNGEVFGDTKAHVKQLTYNNYTFSDLHFDGRYEPQLFRGSSSIDDPHIKVDFNGIVNVQSTNPEMNFNLICHHFDSSPFTEDGQPGVETSFAMNVDLNGAQVDEISGYVVIDSLALATRYDSMLLKQLTLVASASSDKAKSISLNSDNLHVQADGEFRYADLLPALQSMMHHYLPTVIDAPTAKWTPVSLSLRAEGERLREVQRLFEAPVTISDHSSLAADLSLSPSTSRFAPQPFVNMRFFAPGVRANGTPIHDLLVTVQTKENTLDFRVSAEVDNTQLDFSTSAVNDSLLTNLSFNRLAQVIEKIPEELLTAKESYAAQLFAEWEGNYSGDIGLITHFSKYAKKPLVELHFMPSELILRDSLYTLSESQMTYCAAESSLQIDHFSFAGAGQFIRAHGMASERPTDTLTIGLQQIDASYAIPFVLPKKIIIFNGLMTGNADITGIFGQPLVESLIHIDSFGLNNCYFGEADVDLHVYPTRQIGDSILPPELRFHADVDRPDRRVVALDGEANFASGHWELDMMSNHVPLDFINHWTHSVIDSLDGEGSGRIVVGNIPQKKDRNVYVLLQTKAHHSSLTIPWNNVRYTIESDSILMDTTAIRFPNVHLTDAYGNPVEIDGAIRHNGFKDYRLDLHVDAHDALVFNSNIPGEMIQGTVFADGHVDITGKDKDILVAATAKTSKNSKFRFSIDNASSAYESNFIHFVEHPKQDTVAVVETDLDNIDLPQQVRKRTFYIPNGRCVLKLNIDVNPFLLFQLVLGERNGDMLQARGSGALQLNYDTQTGNTGLFGTYEMESGTMTYTVANVIHKDFVVGSGSTIVFSGNASNPQMDVTAKYRATANLKDLFGDDVSQLATTRTNIPVFTCLHMTGPLNNPILNFSLEFPMSDQSIQQQVKQVINTDEMLMRQVIYLLVFNRFFTPDYMNRAEYATLNSTYSLLSSTVTGQINAWLSKLTNMLTLGVAIRTEGEGADASQEYEANFQLQPVDRLVINGNFGYRYNDVSNQPFFGDLDVEVLLTEDGQWRLKGYTHTVDKYSLRQASTIQGFGIIWKKDF